MHMRMHLIRCIWLRYSLSFFFSGPVRIPTNTQAARLRIEGLLLQHSIEKQVSLLLLSLWSPSSPEEYEYLALVSVNGQAFVLVSATRETPGARAEGGGGATDVQPFWLKLTGNRTRHSVVRFPRFPEQQL